MLGCHVFLRELEHKLLYMNREDEKHGRRRAVGGGVVIERARGGWAAHHPVNANIGVHGITSHRAVRASRPAPYLTPHLCTFVSARSPCHAFQLANNSTKHFFTRSVGRKNYSSQLDEHPPQTHNDLEWERGGNGRQRWQQEYRSRRGGSQPRWTPYSTRARNTRCNRQSS